MREVVVKDEGQNPTGPLKDRASGVAVAKALEQGASVVSCSSTCNAASSLAGLASSAGLRSVVFVPERVPEGKLVQLLMFGSTVVRVQGAYSEAYDLSVAAIERYGWYKGVSRALRYWPGFSNSQDAGGSGSGLQSHVYGPSDWQSSFVWIWRYPGGFDSSLCSARFRKGAAGSRGVELAKVVPPVLPQAGPIETVWIECRRGHPISQLQGAPPEDESCGT